jgi:hypothetical protein
MKLDENEKYILEIFRDKDADKLLIGIWFDN